MAGYSGFSMSNNAVAAYQDGEKPLSKWTKRDILNAIIDAIHEGGLILSCSLEKLKKIPVKELKKIMPVSFVLASHKQLLQYNGFLYAGCWCR